MAKTLLFDYTFDASARTVTLHGNKHQRRMLLITNTTDNQIIYNFADTTRTGTFSYDATTDHTTITLLYDTTSMSDSDALQVLEEDDSVKMEPSETFVDAVSKFRVSNPENLIDTDFEYGPQASKWETIQTINNIPSFFASTSDTTIPFISKVEAVKDNELITVTTSFDHNLTSGVPITVTGLASVTAEGTYIIQAVPTSTSFTYKARSGQPATRELQGVYTSIIPGKFFQGSQISLDQSIGIVSDLYNYPVTVQTITKLTVDSDPTEDWIIGTSITGATSGATGLIMRIEGRDLYIGNVAAVFQDGEDIGGSGIDAAAPLTIASSGGVTTEGYRFLLDIDGSGVPQLYPALPMTRKGIYTFDVSDNSCSTHPFSFSTTADGTHGGGSEYTTYVYRHGTEGTAGAYVRIYVNNASPENLYYYCANHANCGGNAGATISNIDVTDVSYNPISGDMVLTIGSHSLEVGTRIKLKTESIKLTCDYKGDGNTTVKSYPRASGAATSNGADYVYNQAIPILAVTGTTVTVNVNGGQGPVTDTSVHVHSGGTATGAVIAGVQNGVAMLAATQTSKVFLTTVAEHGFADNTNFYFINTVSPKILELQDPTATAPDGNPYVDTIQQTVNNIEPDMTEITPYNYESTHTLSFDESQVDYSNDWITFDSDHKLLDGYPVLYYPPPGARPIGDCRRMQVYYIERISNTRLALHHSQRRNYGRVNLYQSYSGTWDGNWSYGKHKLGLVYNCRREYKHGNEHDTKMYTYYWDYGGTYSGWDFNNIDNNYGIGGQNWELTAFFSTNRPERGGYGAQWYYWNWAWRHAFGTYWRTYGYHQQSLPLSSSSQWQGQYDFITDDHNYGVNTHNNGGTSYGYTVGGRYGHGGSKSYWTENNFYINGWSGGQYMRLYGSEWYYWYNQGYYHNTINHYFRGIGEDGGTNVYWILLKRNTSTNDSFYKQNHGLSTNASAQLSMPSGGEIHYYYDWHGNRTNTTSGTWYIDKIDSNRFRIKSSTGASPMRLAGVTGQVRFQATITNPLRDSIYIATNQFSNNEVIKYTGASGAIGGLTSGNSYYIKTISGDRFQLANSVNGSAIQLSSTGSGIQEFENTTADFGVVDGSYTTVKAISETELEVSIPFKVPPSMKQFDGSSNDVDTSSDWINIANHYYATGTRVIYDNQGNSSITGLEHNKDYYVIVIDNNHFKLADSLANALAGTQVDITGTSSGFHQLISAALSGEVGGTGTVAVTNGSRRVTGTNAAFQRFFKIGDTIKIVNTTGGTPGVIESHTITAITDDDNLIVDSAWSFTQASTNYMIPSYIYVRPDGFYLHRPFDGGMEIGTSKSPNSRISRQTRKYFRYQSGKGIQTSLAINFTPQVPIVNLTFASSGGQQTQNATGTIDVNIVTVADTSVLVTNMPITGTGIGAACRLRKIVDATTIMVSAPLTQSITAEPLTFHPVLTAECTTTKPHQLSPGLSIKIIECDTPEFNVTTDVLSVNNEFTFTYLLEHTPSASTGAGFPTLAVLSWRDCMVRAGMFDDQNGFFFEADGATLNCVRRSSVQQVPGTVTVTKGSQIVTGTDTKFTSQLVVGDMTVIRGMSYKVVKVANNTQITIQPSYRGTTNADVIMTKTVDTRVGQANWNIDKGDGTGKSAYIIDTSKIQMCYMDYSWYGAGKIRFGFKDQHGHVKYFHEFKHNNINTESYFRSGNLPARYEIENGIDPNYVGTLFHWGTSVIMDGTFQDDEAYLFTASGITHKYTNSSANAAQSNNNSTILEERINWYYRRYFIRIPFDNGSYGSILTINTNLYESSVANGYFQDGRTIDTRSYQSGSTYYVYVAYLEGTQDRFPRNYYSQINSTLGNPAVPNNTTFSVGAPSGNENLIPVDMPLISIRLAPSVDSSITGALGDREIINRMQLKLDSVGILTTHETEISLRLNPALSTDTFENVENPSLCQLVKHGSADTLSSGSTILSFRASGAGSGQTASTNFDLTKISALGNSILGGDGIYPNGPDLLTVVGNIVDSSGVNLSNPYSISARITWQESQA